MEVGTQPDNTPRSLLERAAALQAPFWSLAGYKTWARVVDVYDGDTMTLILPLPNEMDSPSRLVKYNIRLEGVDTPELRVAATKEAALNARARVVEWITQGALQREQVRPWTRAELAECLQAHAYLVIAHCGAFDKYGRLLAQLTLGDGDGDSDTLSQVLIAEHFANPYDGGTKQSI